MAFVRFTFALLGIVLGACATSADAQGTPKPRVVVTTDPELDDSNSLIRFLLYGTDVRVEGLVYASSQFHWKGDGSGKTWSVAGREYKRFGLDLCPCESWRWASGERFIDDAVDVYERVYANLRVHRSDFPSPTELRSKIRWGNVEFDGDISKDTPGSDLIRDLLLGSDPEPIYLLAWGGASTIARALKSIEERHGTSAEWPAVRARVSRKAILSLSGDQDDTYATYIRPNWPDVRTLTAGPGAVGVGYGAFVRASPENASYFSAEWTRANVSSRGPLGAHYRVWGDGKQMVPGDRFDYFGLADQSADELRAKGYVVWLAPRPKGEFLGEGDTFTFFNLIGNGLDAFRAETPGGWGGRAVVNPASPPSSPPPNFTPAAQNDFAARLLWSITPAYAGANHEPAVAIRGSSRIVARPGETVRLEAVASDPDRDTVTLRWWRWKDVDTYPGDVTLSNPAAPTVEFRLPDDAMPGQVIQLVVEATDSGRPALTRYQRLAVSVTR